MALSPEERCANGTWTVRSEGGRERVEALGWEDGGVGGKTVGGAGAGT